MGHPDPQHPGQHPGDQNYPAAGAPRPTRPVERDEYGATAGFDGAYPPPPAPAAPSGQGYPPQDPPTQAYPGGYQLGYSGGTPQPYDGSLPPQGPPPGPGGPGGGGGDGSGGGNNKKLLWIAVAVIVFVLVLATIVVLVATGGSKNTAATSNPTTTAPTTTAPSSKGGIALPSGIPTAIPSDISIPPIYGGSTTGANARKWTVEVTGSGTAQVITVGVPDTNTIGTQQLPWSKSFTSDAFLVTVTVFGPKQDMACKITRDGAVVSQEKASNGPLICSAS